MEVDIDTNWQKSNLIQSSNKFIKELRQVKKKTEKDYDGIRILCDNFYGKVIEMNKIVIAIDNWNPYADIIFISHAHTDHLPFFPKNAFSELKINTKSPKIICSKITKEIGKFRTKGKFDFPEDLWLLGNDFDNKKDHISQTIEYKGLKISIIESGHAYGSLSLILEGNKKILYTGDFNTEDRFFDQNKTPIKGLNPIKCDFLIIECTFGTPRYCFPSFKNLQVELNQFVEKYVSEGNTIVLPAYIYGKSQILLNTIKSSEKVLLSPEIAKITQILENNDFKFTNWDSFGTLNKKDQAKKLKGSLIIVPSAVKFLEKFKKVLNAKYKIVVCSGKVLNESYRNEFPADTYYPLSDHCDFNRLIEFVQKCEPKEIFLEHGKIEEFSYYLSKTLKGSNIKHVPINIFKSLDQNQFLIV